LFLLANPMAHILNFLAIRNILGEPRIISNYLKIFV